MNGKFHKSLHSFFYRVLELRIKADFKTKSNSTEIKGGGALNPPLIAFYLRPNMSYLFIKSSMVVLSVKYSVVC